jgi:hypothetical protein
VFLSFFWAPLTDIEQQIRKKLKINMEIKLFSSLRKHVDTKSPSPQMQVGEPPKDEQSNKKCYFDASKLV